MTATIDMGQIIGVVVAAAVLHMIGTAVALIAFRSKSETEQKTTNARLGNIEKALGLRDPDEVSFMRRSEGREIHDKLDEHDEALGKHAAAIAQLRR